MLKPNATVGEVACYARQEAVIEAYKTLGTLGKAAESVGLVSQTAYEWTANNTHDFNARLAKVGLPGYRDHLEAMVEERLSNPTGNRGSDVLLMGALNANHPDKWSRNIQVTHEVGREVMATLQKIQQQQQGAPGPLQRTAPEPWEVEGKAAVVEEEEG